MRRIQRNPKQQRIDQVIMGCMRRDSHSLNVVLADRSLIDARSSLGFTPLFGACYVLWPHAVRALLDAGASPFDVGLGDALDAVDLGLRDAQGGAHARRKADQIVAMLRAHGMGMPLAA